MTAKNKGKREARKTKIWMKREQSEKLVESWRSDGSYPTVSKDGELEDVRPITGGETRRKK